MTASNYLTIIPYRTDLRPISGLPIVNTASTVYDSLVPDSVTLTFSPLTTDNRTTFSAVLRNPTNYAVFSLATASLVPEPTVLRLFAIGLLGLGWRRTKDGI